MDGKLKASREANAMTGYLVRALNHSVGSWAVPRPVFLNGTFRLGLIAILQVMMPGATTVLMLYFAAALYDEVFHEYLIGLSVLAAILAAMLIKLPLAGAAPRSRAARCKEAARLCVQWLGVMAVVALTGYLTGFQHHYDSALITFWAVSTPMVIFALHWLLDAMFRRILMTKSLVRSCIIAGVNPPGRQLADRINRHPELGFELRGFFDDRSLERLGMEGELELLGGLNDVSEYVRQTGVKVIFIALPMRHVKRVMEMLDALRDSTISIYYVPDLFVFHLIQARYGDLMGVPVISMCETPFAGSRGVFKRVSDVLLTLLILIPALPVMALIAMLVRLTSRGPVIFRQYRYGLDGARITVYKFRSMYVSENGARVVQARRGDARITPIGRILRKTSLDELPQLFNVLQGRMSLIGPRPHAVAHNEEYRGQIKGYMIRHKVLPGITGLAQVNGCRGETSELTDMEARIHYDLEYLRQWSPLLDLKILLLTAVQVVKGEKAY